MDAIGSEPPTGRYYGCFLPHLYDHQRPHSALRDQTPASVAAQHRGEAERRFAFSIGNRALHKIPPMLPQTAWAGIDITHLAITLIKHRRSDRARKRTQRRTSGK